MGDVMTGARVRVSVDLGWLKAQVLARSRATGKTPSEVIRDAVVRLRGAEEPPVEVAELDAGLRHGARVRIGLRMSRGQAEDFRRAARRAGLAPAAYVSALVAGVPAVAGRASDGSTLADQRRALLASSAEMASLARDLRRLVRLLSMGDVAAAKVYRERLDGAEQAIHAHLALAGAVVEALSPQRVPGDQKSRVTRRSSATRLPVTSERGMPASGAPRKPWRA